MLFNKTLIILIISLVSFAAVSQFLLINNSHDPSSYREEIASNISTINLSFGNMVKKYVNINFDFAGFDFLKPFVLVCCGTILLLGIDFTMRRRISDAIKRFRSQTKDR